MNAMKYTRNMQHDSGWQRARQGSMLFSEVFKPALQAIRSFKQHDGKQLEVLRGYQPHYPWTSRIYRKITDWWGDKKKHVEIKIQDSDNYNRCKWKRPWNLEGSNFKEQGSWRHLKCGIRTGLADKEIAESFSISAATIYTRRIWLGLLFFWWMSSNRHWHRS